MEQLDETDKEVSAINHGELHMKLLEIKEMHPILKREVTRHKFPGGHGETLIFQWPDNLCHEDHISFKLLNVRIFFFKTNFRNKD